MPEIRIKLDGGREAWEPGMFLSGRFEMRHVGDWIADYIDLVVWWDTHGKGDQDTGIVHRESHAQKGERIPSEKSQAFRVKLPAAPWTYHGKLIKIDWYVGVYARERRKAEDAVITPIRVYPGAVEVPASPVEDFLPDAPPLE